MKTKSRAHQDLKGQVALVTGGAGGMGSEIGCTLAQAGAQVVLADLNREALRAVAAGIPRALPLEVDIGQSAAVQRMMDQVMRQYGRLDILVNNAAIHVQKLVVDLEDEDWQRVFSVNAVGTFYGSRAAARIMMERRSGRIINVVTRLTAVPYSAPYIASKHAIWGFTQCLALELARYGVTVNALAPGPTLGTGMEKWFRAKAALTRTPWAQFKKMLVEAIPLGRLCQPRDVAQVVHFLASDKASYITGELIHVTGGWMGYGAAVQPTPRGKKQ